MAEKQPVEPEHSRTRVLYSVSTLRAPFLTRTDPLNFVLLLHWRVSAIVTSPLGESRMRLFRSFALILLLTVFGLPHALAADSNAPDTQRNYSTVKLFFTHLYTNHGPGLGGGGGGAMGGGIRFETVRLYLNDKFIGNTVLGPFDANPTLNLNPGEHRFRVECDGYRNFETKIEVLQNGSTQWLVVKLDKLTRADEPPPSDEDSAIHVPTPPDIVAKMLELAQVGKDDLLYDLGCGDGRIVVAAASKYGCRAVGYDIDARKVQQSSENVKRHGAEKLVRIERKDIFKLDLRDATVVTLYLLPEMNDRLIPQLEKLKDGSRIVCHQFAFEGIQHDRMLTIKSQLDGVPRDIYLYTLPFTKLFDLETGSVDDSPFEAEE